jgi:phosphatidate cytidylyltransferase
VGDSDRPRDIKSQLEHAGHDVERQIQKAQAQFDGLSEEITRRTGRNLIFAVGIGLALGLGVLFSLIFVTDIFMGFAALIFATATLEIALALQTAGRHVPRIPTVVVALGIPPAAYYGGVTWLWLSLVGGLAFIVLWRLAEQALPRFRTSGAALVEDLTAAVFTQVYVSGLASFAVLLCSPSNPNGKWWTLAFVIIVVATDTGAYAGGMLCGKHPMAPTISPKKTWEGLACAAFVALLAGVLLTIFMLRLPWWLGLVVGAVVLVAATVGDLAESLIKRDIGVKDMSDWLPGHGGFLDRLDSMLPSAVATYALYLVFQPLLG